MADVITAFRRLTICLCAALLPGAVSARVASAAGVLPAANATYTTIDVPGANWTNANAVNRSGPLGHSVEVVGTYDDIQGLHGFLLSGGHYTKLDVPVQDAVNTTALGINSLHQVVGTYYNAYAGATCGYLYAGGTYTNLGLASCSLYQPPYRFFAFGINDAGNVAGSYSAPGKVEGFFGMTNTVLQSGYDFPGDLGTWIFGLNNNPAHQMVGDFVDASGNAHGALFTGQNTSGTSFDVPGTSAGTIGRGVNDTGQIVGSYGAVNCPCESGVYAPHGFVDDNGRYAGIDYPGARATVVNGVNNADPLNGAYSVVGSYARPGDAYYRSHAFLATVSHVIGSMP